MSYFIAVVTAGRGVTPKEKMGKGRDYTAGECFGVEGTTILLGRVPGEPWSIASIALEMWQFRGGTNGN
jgi:hypothetical protein